jgi:hypothetical protein
MTGASHDATHCHAHLGNAFLALQHVLSLK